MDRRVWPRAVGSIPTVGIMSGNDDSRSERIRLIAQIPLVRVDTKLGYAPAEFHPDKEVVVEEGEEYYVMFGN